MPRRTLPTPEDISEEMLPEQGFRRSITLCQLEGGELTKLCFLFSLHIYSESASGSAPRTARPLTRLTA